MEKKPRGAVRKSLAALYSGDDQSNQQDSSKPAQDESRPKASAGGVPGMVFGKAQERLQDRVDELETELASRRDQPTVILLQPDDVEDLYPAERIALAFGDEDYVALRQSINDHGQDQAILVRPKPNVAGKYQIAYGRRRRAACAELGRQVGAIVKNLTAEQLLQAMIRENDERTAISSYERALFFQGLMAAENVGVRELARRLDLSAALVSRLVNVSKFPESILDMVGDPRPLGIRVLEALSKLISDAQGLKRVEQQWLKIEPAATAQLRAQQILSLSDSGTKRKESQRRLELVGAKQRIGKISWNGNLCRLEFDKDLGKERVEALLQLLRTADV